MTVMEFSHHEPAYRGGCGLALLAALVAELRDCCASQERNVQGDECSGRWKQNPEKTKLRTDESTRICCGFAAFVEAELMLEMDLEGLAERLRQEMELINETELVLGGEPKRADGNGKSEAKGKEKVSESCLGCFICEGKHFTRDCPLKSTAECYFRGEGWRRNGIPMNSSSLAWAEVNSAGCVGCGEARQVSNIGNTCSFGARRMVGELDVCMGAHVVLRSDFVWMYFVKEGTDSLGARRGI
uniref:Eukaryotic translation initiation factor 3 subunit G N-terminal domain-containing protein n=1 Tax=Populus trichocarpa TaxID=3694 RepID=U5GSF6_POPTR